MKAFTKLMTFALILLISVPLFADFPVSTANYWETECAIAYNSTDHEYLVVWQGNYPSGDVYIMGNIWGQRVKEDGTLVGSAFSIFSSGALPDVVYNSSTNEYYVVAVDLGPTIYGQRLSRTGSKIGGAVQLMTNAGYPRVLYNSLGNEYLLIGAYLYESSIDICSIKIFSRRVSAAGQPVGTVQQITDQGHGSCSDGARFSVAYAPISSTETPTGRYLIVVGTPADLKMLNSTGTPMATTYNPQSNSYYSSIPFQQTKIGLAYNVDVAFGYWNGAPVFFIVWGDRNYSWPNYPNWSGIIGGIVEADKILYLTTEGVSNETFPISWILEHNMSSTYAKSWQPVVAYNAVAQKFMVAWRETPTTNQSNDTKVNHIRANEIDTYRIPPPSNTTLSVTNGNEDPQRPAIAASTINANTLIVWEDWRNKSTTDIDLYGNFLKSTPAITEKITILEPNGGEKWYVGSQQEVWWQSQNFNSPVKIEYSTNGGTTWKTISSSTTDKAFPWTIPNDPSTNCLVRVSDAADGNPSDVSDAKFSILAAKLTITSPNGGENWQVGTKQNITWSSQNIPDNDVTIEYSIDNGQTYNFIGVQTNNSSNETWQWDAVPNTPSTNCRIRISVYMQNVLISDISDAVFTISSANNTPQGTNVKVDLGNGIKATFDNVTTPGKTTVTTTNTGPPPPDQFTIIPINPPTFYNITTTANFTGKVTVCITYDDTKINPPSLEKSLRLRVYELDSATGKWKWVDITKSLDDVNNIICGEVTHLSLFALMAPAGDMPIVKIDPKSSNMRKGSPDSIDVVIENVTNLGGFEFEISFDGAIVTVEQSADVIAGAFVGSTGRSYFFIGPNIDNTTGSVIYAVASLGSQAGPNGSGVLATIIWTPQAEGNTTLDLKNVKVTDINANEIPVIEEGGEINVTTRFWADIDGDNDIDIIDVQLVAAHWNSQVGDANYDSRYDVDNNGQGDGDVDIIDVQLVASWWNKQVPSGSGLLSALFDEPTGNLNKQMENTKLRIIPEQPFENGTPSSIAIVVENAVDLGAFQFDVMLNRTDLNISDIQLGEFLAMSENEVITLEPKRSEDGDRMTFAAFSFGNKSGADGCGVLARIKLAADMGSPAIDFENFLLVDKNGKQLEINSINNEFTSLMGKQSIPQQFSLWQNYPNPFNPETAISFELPAGTTDQIRVGLRIYNMQGQLVRTLIDENKSAGVHTVKWDGKNELGERVPSGLYLYSLTAGAFKTSRKMLFLK